MRALFVNAVERNHHNPLRMADCREPMGDYQGGASPGHGLQRPLHGELALIGQRTGSLVKDKDGWILWTPPRNAQTLSLAT